MDKCLHGISYDEPCMGCEALVTLATRTGKPPPLGVKSRLVIPPIYTDVVVDGKVAAVTLENPPVVTSVPADLTPLIPDLDKAVSAPIRVDPPPEGITTRSPEEINMAAAEAEALAQAVAKVDHEFPKLGFIDVAAELEWVSRKANEMPEQERRSYPEVIRAKILAHESNKSNPAVTDEEICVAIYLIRTFNTPLTQEEIEAKTKGKPPKVDKPVKPKKEKKKTGLDAFNFDDPAATPENPTS
jgi:hypothetical protein